MKHFMLIFVLATAFGLGSAAAEPGGNRDEAVFVGLWKGSLKVGAVSLRIEFNVEFHDGVLQATMDSPDQGVKGIPVSRVALADSVVSFEVKAISGSYEGKLSADGQRLEGNWKQSGRNFPLVLQKAGVSVVPGAADVPPAPVPGQAPGATQAPVSSQEPKKPYPYDAVDVVFQNPKAGISLSGTLTIPRGEGPFPAVVLVTGSGAQNRDEEILGHKPFLVIADYLARRGIAALRYDDRGVGGSGGDFAAATTFDFADDALAAADFLAGQSRIDAKRVGVVGHSEGAIIAGIAASADPGIAFIVMLAGPGVRGDKLLVMQGAAIAGASGMDAEAVAEASALNAELYGIAMRPGELSDLRAAIVSMLKNLDGKAGEGSSPESQGGPSADVREAEAGRVADQLLSPWFRTFLVLDPAIYLSKVRVPALALNGSRDLQVPAGDNLRAIGLALNAAGNCSYKLIQLEGLNHLFQHAATGLPDEYGSNPETFAPEALQAMGDWIGSVVR